MTLKEQMEIMLPVIEGELRAQVDRLDRADSHTFHDMLTYHMGWTGEGAGPEARGKRIRPLLLLLTTAACSDSGWQHAAPAAAAVELVHNFSLVHDDIQDNSSMRRGRATVWKKWDVAQAINAGDALFVISNLSILDLDRHYSSDLVIQVARVLHETCLELTRGQFLDMSYETRGDLAVDDYWRMSEGKTAALLSACTQAGAILGGANAVSIELYRTFGRDLGLAFQVQDDILGIWGDEAITGKPAGGDLVEGKNSLPVLFGISKNGPFAKRWAGSPIQPEEVAEISRVLREEGAADYAQQEGERLTERALEALEMANPRGEAGGALVEMAHKLLHREN